ncbi:hypothetical protein FA15DRAFT_705310 [Coprinopsis marcescibilis]|uniref:Uncharacterized protein n=1 Tax=Coprinopsis marcescibilis TaxID=230819 RepID=A0A5C3L5X6_COPMA|nr:hypothetical protein FA15DRAFT_705310 [Coprinopsis marcescibilis]
MDGGQYRLLAIAFSTAGVEGFLDGIFFVLCLTAVYLLVHRSPNRKSGKCGLFTNLTMPMVFGSIVLLLLICAHWVCTMVRIIQVVSLISRGESPAYFLLHDVSGMYSAMSFLIVLAVSVTDALLFVDYEHLLGSHWNAGDNDNEHVLLCLMVCIYKIQSKTLFGDSKRLKSILVIIVESAAIWTAWSIFVFINYHLQSFLSIFTFDGGPAVAGIAFMLINVRVGLGWDTSPASADNPPAAGLPTFRVTLSEKSSTGSYGQVSARPRSVTWSSPV